MYPINYIKFENLLPKKSRLGYTLYINYLPDKLFVKYKALARQVEHIFPKELILDNNFFTALGLSTGDGLNNPSIRNTHYNFANSNFYLVYIVYNWLLKYFNINKRSFQFQLFQKNKNLDSIVKIRSFFNINTSRIKVYYSNRYKEDVLVIQISNPIFQLLYLKLFDTLKQEILKNENYRRSFLKGLFAAEGHVKHSIYGTIENLSFAFNPHNEIELAQFIFECFNREGIEFKINDSLIYTCGYNNMLKTYLLGIIQLHIKKKNKFLRLIKNANYFLHFKKNSLDLLRDKSQYELAKILGCSQSGISKMLKKNYLSYKNIRKLENKALVNPEKLFNKIDFITVSTTHIRDSKCIDFLKKEIFLNRLSHNSE
ncbi:hypothetical protein JXB41_08455 [Candidatus Woesearchaeota archaeon]|nr:hypothetical protein [Candidatus Woesearchaeota archaeon]